MSWRSIWSYHDIRKGSGKLFVDGDFFKHSFVDVDEQLSFDWHSIFGRKLPIDRNPAPIMQTIYTKRTMSDLSMRDLDEKAHNLAD